MISIITYICVFQILEKGHLSDGGAGGPLLVLQPDLLQGHHGVRQPGLALVHGGVGSLQKFMMKSNMFQSSLLKIIKI